MHAHAATTNASIDPPSIRPPSLLDMSNGLPPPVSDCGFALLVGEAALLVVDVDVGASSCVNVVVGSPPMPSSSD